MTALLDSTQCRWTENKGEGEGGDNMRQRPQFVFEPSALWGCGVN